MPQKAAFRQEVENVEAVDQGRHDQNYRAVAAIIEQAGRAFAPQHPRGFVTAAVRMPTIGFQACEIGFGAARDLEIERRRDAIRPDRVDLGREAEKALDERARRQRRVFQEGQDGPRARPQHHCARQVRRQRARHQPAVQAALIACPPRRHVNQNRRLPRRWHLRGARSDIPPRLPKSGGRRLLHRSSQSIYPALQSGGAIRQPMARV